MSDSKIKTTTTATKKIFILITIGLSFLLALWFWSMQQPLTNLEGGFLPNIDMNFDFDLDST